MAAVCKFNKFSHCRYGRFCNFKHENQKCKVKNCDAKVCDLRHPPPCRNILQKKSCPFGDLCSFEHDVESSANKYLYDQLEEKLIEFEKLLAAKDNEIKDLKSTINALNDVINISETETSDSEPDDFIDEDEKEEFSDFMCEYCDFSTRNSTGLKIHNTKVHKKSSKVSGSDLELQKNLETKKVNNEKDLVMKKIVMDEECLGIYSLSKPREDSFPNLFLHCKDCWELLGHSCPYIPKARVTPPDHFDPDEEEVLSDLDFYHPTLHTTMATVDLGDLYREGCSSDWARVKEILEKYTSRA